MGEQDHTGRDAEQAAVNALAVFMRDHPPDEMPSPRLTLRDACDVQRLVNIAEQGRARPTEPTP